MNTLHPMKGKRYPRMVEILDWHHDGFEYRGNGEDVALLPTPELALKIAAGELKQCMTARYYKKHRG